MPLEILGQDTVNNTHTCFGVSLWTAGFNAGLQALLVSAKARQSGYACFSNAHMVGEAARNPSLAEAMAAADWVFPDGRPVAKLLKWRGAAQTEQVPGPEMAEQLMQSAAAEELPIYLYGGTQAVLERLTSVLAERMPGLRIAGYFSPPFRPRTKIEELEDADRIRASGAAICLVALGCPRQETWMHRNAEASGTVCLGVGAAFPMLSGDTPRAPHWVRKHGLEWLYRWMQEPRRLTSRYTLGNLRFGREVLRELTRAKALPPRTSR